MTAAALAATHRAAFTHTRPWTAAELSSLLTQRGVILCGDARSFVIARVIADEAEILTLATHPDFQRQGRACAVLDEFLGTCKSLAVTSLFLEVAENNQPAKALYLKTGFEKVGHRPQYYDGTNGAKIGADVLRLTF